MPHHVFFSLSSGLAGPLQVPTGTLDRLVKHVQHMETTLGLTPTRYKSNPPHWSHRDKLSPPKAQDLTDEEFCTLLSHHNDWVRRTHREFGEWYQNPVEDGEVITPDDVMTFWQGLTLLDVPVERWTGPYYTDRMEHLYEVLRGRESEGVTLGSDPLTTQQAGAVVRLLEQYLDPGDHRLEVCRGRDHLTSSETEGYMWCDQCGDAVHPDDFDDALVRCSNTRCPLLEYADESEAGCHLYTQTQVRVTQDGSPWEWDRRWEDLSDTERQLWIRHSRSLHPPPPRSAAEGPCPLDSTGGDQ